MDLHLIFQWHQLLHFIMPILIIILLNKRLGLRNTSVLVFILGIMKEIRDRIMYEDALWLSGIDIILDLIGILLGIIIVKNINLIRNKLLKQNNEAKINE